MGLLCPEKSGLAMVNGERSALHFSEQPQFRKGGLIFTMAREKSAVHIITYLHIMD